MKIKSCARWIALLASLSTAQLSHAGLLYYQGFSYGETDGALTTVGSADWTSPADIHANYNTTGLSYGNLTVAGGSAQTNSAWGDGTTNTVTHDFEDIDISTKNEVWISFLMAAPSTVTTANASATFGVNITRNNWQNAVNYTAGKSWANNTAYTASPGSTSISGAEFATVTTDTLLVVFKLTKGANTEVWLNPTIGSTTPVAGTGLTIGSAGNLTSINSIALSFQGQSLHFDELRVGDTFMDVTPTGIPEPSTYAALFGVAALGLGVLRRRRR